VPLPPIPRGPAGTGPREDLEHVQHLGELVGSIPSSSGVVNGVYTYSIPLRVPEGPGGLNPSLSLEYSSNSENGLLGVGWTIGGLSSITRCAYNRASDGKTRGWSRARRGKFCLDDQSLIFVSEEPNVVTFQTEQATFQRIRAYYADSAATDPAYFTVEAPDGTLRHYGMAPGRSPPDDSNGLGTSLIGEVTRPWSWYLVQIERHSKKIDFYYDRGSSNIALPGRPIPVESALRYLSEVRYADRFIRFVWQDRPDPVNKFAFQQDLSLYKRLSRIEIYSPGSMYSPGAIATGPVFAPAASDEFHEYSTTARWQYLLDYKTSPFTHRSTLARVYLAEQARAPGNQLYAFPPTTFQWNEPIASANDDYVLRSYDVPGPQGELSLYAIAANNNRMVVADFDGDGADDVLYSLVVPATTLSPPQSKLFMRMGSASGLSSHQIDVTADIFQSGQFFSLAGAMAADMDGDGRTELLLVSSGEEEIKFNNPRPCPYRAYVFSQLNFQEVSALTERLCLLKGTRRFYDLSTGPAGELPGPNTRVPLVLGDFDGDGVTDFHGGSVWQGYPPATASNCSPGIDCGLHPEQRKLFCARGDRQFLGKGTSCASNIPLGSYITGDADGDRRIDFLSTSTGPLSGDPGYVQNTRRPSPFEFLLGEPHHTSIYWTGTLPNVWLRLLDFNGDGIEDLFDFEPMSAVDLCGPSSRQISFKLWQNKGLWDSAAESIPTSSVEYSLPVSNYPISACSENRPAFYPRSLRESDFNGDGIGDLLLLNPGVGGPSVDVDAQLGGDSNVVGYNVPPVLLLSNGFEYTPVALPLGGARLRQLAPDCFQPTDEPGVWNANGTPENPCRRTEADWDYAQVGDIDGDGVADLIQFSAVGLALRLETLTLRKAEIGITHRRDVIVSVRNGFQQTALAAEVAERIEYADGRSLRDSGAFRCDSLAQMPGADESAGAMDPEAFFRTVCPMRGTFLVRQFLPGGRTVQEGGIRYGYDTPVVDVHGRGMLGFKTVKEFDVRDNVLKVTQNNHTCALYAVDSDPPPGESSLTGRVCFVENVGVRVTKTSHHQSERVDGGISLPGSPRPLLSTLTTTVRERVQGVENGSGVSSEGTFQIRVARIDQETTYLSDALSAVLLVSGPSLSETTEFAYEDGFGNPTMVTRSRVGANGESSSEVVETEYRNEMGQVWLVGLPERIMTTKTSPAGVSGTRTIEKTYHSDGRLETVILEPQGPPELRSTTTYEYEATPNSPLYKNLTGVAVAARNMIRNQDETRRTTISYDSTGVNVTAVTDPVGLTTHWGYASGLDSIVSVVDANGVGTDFVVDGMGRRRFAYPDDGQASGTYFVNRSAGGLVAVSQISVASGTPNGECLSPAIRLQDKCFVTSEVAHLDARGRLTRRSATGLNGELYHTYYLYDSKGRLSAFSRPTLSSTGVHWTIHSYDDLDRVEGETAPDQTIKRFQYPSYFTTLKIDERGNQTRRTVDVHGRIALTEEWIDALTPPVTTEQMYDSFGSVERIVRLDRTGNEQETSFTYDTLGRNISRTTAASGTSWSFYDGFGDVWREEDAGGSRSIHRDASGRAALSVADDDPADYQDFIWDQAANGLGKLASVGSQPDGVSRVFEYDARGRKRLETVSVPATAGGPARSYSIRQTYDSEGRPDVTVYPSPNGEVSGSYWTRKKYSPFNYLASVSAPSGEALWTLENATPELIRERLGDGSTMRNTFDVRTGQVQRSNTNLASGQLLQDYSYEYYANGDIAARTETVSETLEAFDYDGLGRLQHWSYRGSGVSQSRIRTYEYSDFGDLEGITDRAGASIVSSESFVLGVTVSGRFNPHAVAAWGPYEYEYDARGRRVTKRWTVGAVAHALETEFNQWDLPSSVTAVQTGSGGAPQRTPVEALLYDGFGTRVVKTELASGREVRYIDPEFDHLLHAGTNQAVVHVRVGTATVAEVNQTLSTQGVSTSVVYPHRDLLGSTTAVTGGPVPLRAYYEPFGKLLEADGVSPGAGPGLRHDFTGHERENDLINMGGRIYDPELRRFISVDPIVVDPGLSQSHNPYSYVVNNPLRYVDLTGYDYTGRGEGGAWCSGDPAQCVAPGVDGGGGLRGGSQPGWGPYGGSTPPTPPPGEGVLRHSQEEALRGMFGNQVGVGASPPQSSASSVQTSSVVQEFEAQLIHEAENTPLPAPMSPIEKVREDMAFVAEFLWLAQPPYGQNQTLDAIWGSGVPKCNKFSCDVGNIAGARITMGPNGGTPPQAADFATGKVPGFDVVSANDVQRGDFVAQQRQYSNATGHMGVVTKTASNARHHIVISAQERITRKPLEQVFPSKYKNPIVYLRWVGLP